MLWYQKLMNNLVSQEFEKISTEVEITGHQVAEFEKVASGLEKISVINEVDIPSFAGTIKGIAKLASDSFVEMRVQNEHLSRQLDMHKKASKVREIVEEMVKKGSITEDNLEEKVTELMEKSSEDLEIYKQAVDLIASKEFAGSSYGTLDGGDVIGKSSPFDDVING